MSNILRFLKTNKRYLLGLFFFLFVAYEFILRLWVSQMGGTFDLESWSIVAKAVLDKESVYAATSRYNYGPIWSYILGFIAYVINYPAVSTLNQYHLAIVAFLSLVDCLIALCLWRMFGKISGILYLLNPVSVLLTGYHSQLDNFAVLLGFLGWLVYRKSQKVNSLKMYFLSAVLIGLSLMTKQILFIFPIWLFIAGDAFKRKYLYRIMFVLITYVVFISGFALEIITHFQDRLLIYQGIMVNVFGYKSSYGHAVLIDFLNLFFPVAYIKSMFDWVPVFKGYTFLYFLVLTLAGLLINKKYGKTDLFYPLYLLFFFALSPALADQYIAIPLIAVAVFYYRWETLLFSTVGFAYLAAGTSANLGNSLTYAMNLGIGNHVLTFFPWSNYYRLRDIAVQGWLFLLSISIVIRAYIKADLEAIHKIFYALANLLKKALPKLQFLILGFLNLMLLVYMYMFFIGPKEKEIKVISGSYGYNCGIPRSNVTKEVSKTCDGLSSCLNLINFADPAVGCSKKYRIDWTCNYNNFLYPIYYVEIGNEAAGSQQELTCPQLK